MPTIVLVTGSSGFIGKNLCAKLATNDQIEIIKYDRSHSEDDLSKFIDRAEFIYHLAGVNRPINEEEFKQQNTDLTAKIIELLKAKNKKTPLLISSSVQADLDNPYGKSKLAAEKVVFSWQAESQSSVYVYRLPGVFGKWCKPNYNSVVATFCHNIANDLPIEISAPTHVVTLSYIDDVVSQFISHLDDKNTSEGPSIRSMSQTFEITLEDLSARIYDIHNIRTTLKVPDLNDKLNKYLYATYTSYLANDSFSYELTKNEDNRGWLAEFIKSEHFGQIFISRTMPGITRGDHWHNTKIEKFLVVEGNADITFRNKIDEQNIIKYSVTGKDAKVLDIPTGYVHAITNTGAKELVTLFWANEILDKDNPDTIYEKVTTE